MATARNDDGQGRPQSILLEDGRVEPRLDDLMNCDVMKSVMARDSVGRDDLKKIVSKARDSLRKKKAA